MKGELKWGKSLKNQNTYGYDYDSENSPKMTNVHVENPYDE